MTEGEDKPKWHPLNVRDTTAAVEYDALVEGIPDHLERSIWRWVMDRAARSSDLVYKVERALRIKLPETPQKANLFDLQWSISGPMERLTLVDFFLRDLQEVYEHATSDPDRGAAMLAWAQLDVMLAEGGSVWRVSREPYWSLVRRLNETTQALADLASSPSTDAARKIASAWRACYQHGPDYDRAYRDAVLAVEAVALPVAVPDNQRGTLGNVVSHIADTVDRWTVGGLDDERQTSGATLLAMLRTLWHNQQRHAQNDGSILSVSQTEAETAVTLAVTLVHWFASGLVRRAEG